ncbi:MAG: hypothetical protein ABGY09_08035 [Euryarchaeota archaeon]
MSVLTLICVLNALAVVGFASLAWFSLRYGMPRWLLAMTVAPGMLGSALVDAVMLRLGFYGVPVETTLALIAYGMAWRWGRPSGPGSR